MSRYLCAVVETYRVDNESEADELIAQARENSIYELKKYNLQKKEVKAKGEIVDEYYLLSLTKSIQDSKEPTTYIELEYKEF